MTGTMRPNAGRVDQRRTSGRGAGSATCPLRLANTPNPSDQSAGRGTKTARLAKAGPDGFYMFPIGMFPIGMGPSGSTPDR